MDRALILSDNKQHNDSNIINDDSNNDSRANECCNWYVIIWSIFALLLNDNISFVSDIIIRVLIEELFERDKNLFQNDNADLWIDSFWSSLFASNVDDYSDFYSTIIISYFIKDKVWL